MWAVIALLVLAGQVYSYNNGKNKSSEKAYDPQEPTIDIEPIYSKKNNWYLITLALIEGWRMIELSKLELIEV